MRKLLTMALALVMLTFATADKVERDVALHSTEISMKHKEAYKLDDGEFKSIVATKASFGYESNAGTGIFSLLLAISGFFQRNKEKIGLAGLFIVGSYLFDNVSDLSLAVLPLIPFMRNPDVETISGTEVKKLLSEMGVTHKAALDKVTKDTADAIKGVITIDVLKAELEKVGIKSDEIKAISDAVTEQGKVLKELKERTNEKLVGKDIGEMVHDNAEGIKKMADATSKDTFKMKINKTLLQRSALANSTLGYRVPGIGQLPTRLPVIKSLFNNVQLSESDIRDSNGTIRYIDVATTTRGAAMVSEAGTKPESVITWIERFIPIETLADTIPVTKQAYRNLSFVAGEIEKMLRKNLVLKEEQQIYAGTGVSPQLIGLITSAPAVVLASLPQSGLVEGANLYDLIASLKVYVMNGVDASGKQSKYLPNYVLLNPSDILRYKLLKATNGHYLLPPFISADGSTIDGMRVIESSLVVTNTMVVGDFDYGTVYEEDSVTIEMGLINDQFIKNQWTIRAEQSMALLIRNVDKDAFVYVGDITAAIAALETA